EIADVERAGRHQVAAAERCDLALTGADRDAGLAARGGHVEAVVVPAHRLLEPADVEPGGEAGELDGITERPALVGVDDEDEIVAGGGAGDADALGVRLGRASADLELATGMPGGA